MGVRPRVVLVGVLAVTLCEAHARAGWWPPERPPTSVEGPWGTRWTVEVSDRLRGEFVDFFAAKPSKTHKVAKFRYDFLGNKFQAGVRVRRDPWEAFVQFQHTVLDNVPVGPPPAGRPSPVGPGGPYFANTKRSFQEQGWLRQGWVRAEDLFGVKGAGIVVGRQLWRDGLEAPARDANLVWLKRHRIAERLVGPGDYTHIGRSFDGAQVHWDTDWLNVSGFGFQPTSGGFEISAGRPIEGIQLGGLSATLKDSPRFPSSDTRLFWIYYSDHRRFTCDDKAPNNGKCVVDNRPPEVRTGDLRIHTIGANAAHVTALGPGKADVLGSASGQLGAWQALDQRAWAYDVEVGYQLTGLWTRPWARLGFFRGSGDPDPKDRIHETFFQILPTNRQYAQFPFYNMMNNQDTFAQLVLQPHRSLGVRSDFHWLRLVEGKDFLYSGGGATKDDFFGFAGTPPKDAPNGARQIGYLVDIAFTWKPVDLLTFYAYYGHAFGGDVIRQSFAGREANYAYVESTVAF